MAAFQEAFGALLTDPGRATDPALRRALTIHRNTATKAAADALADNYPVVAQLLGDDAFNAATFLFIEQAPPGDPRLCLYGDGFAAFLARHPALEAVPYVADVARLERLWVEAMFAADAPALTGAALAGGIDPAAPLHLHPAARLLDAASPAGSIWAAHQSGADADALNRIEWDSEAVLVSRPGAAVIVTVLSPAAAAFAAQAAAGATLGAAAEAAAAAGDVATAFATLLNAGAFAA